jgi:hypothetical protein
MRIKTKWLVNLKIFKKLLKKEKELNLIKKMIFNYNHKAYKSKVLSAVLRNHNKINIRNSHHFKSLKRKIILKITILQ